MREAEESTYDEGRGEGEVDAGCWLHGEALGCVAATAGHAVGEEFGRRFVGVGRNIIGIYTRGLMRCICHLELRIELCSIDG